MKQQFDSQQSYQLQAISAVCDCFTGVCASAGENGETVANPGIADRGRLLENLRSVQKRTLPKTPPDNELYPLEFSSDDGGQLIEIPNITVEMETGTGKTYTYLRTIYELNRRYGWKKFVIVVPGVAIREGVLKNLELTRDHLQELYNHPPQHYSVYDASRLAGLRRFATSAQLEILLINIDSFTRDINIINQQHESGSRPVDFIRAARPLVILDEPQNMETDLRKKAIANLNPLALIRYSATHRNSYNLVYRLDPLQAYDLGLVKQIEVLGITAADNRDTAYIRFEGIRPGKKSLKAQLKIACVEDGAYKLKTVNTAVGDDLLALSGGRDAYRDGFVVEKIDAANNRLRFANGSALSVGETHGGNDERLWRFQIEQALKEHFEKEAQLAGRGIKVLSLFFIDRVSSYRQYDHENRPRKGRFAEWFEEAFERLKPRGYPFRADDVHDGYFSQDRRGHIKDTSGESKADDATYALIMRDKEKLLEPAEPLRFIFSHSALREGWDNPNIFQICTLNETQSEMKKRQEIGRGLRLPLNSAGQRIRDRDSNILTVIANESYRDFAARLQSEVRRESGVDMGRRIRNAREKSELRLARPLTPKANPRFFELWQRINKKAVYTVQLDAARLQEEALKEVQAMPPVQPQTAIKSERFRVLAGGRRFEAGQSESHDVPQGESVTLPDIVRELSTATAVTRATISTILKESGRLEEFEINPRQFLAQIQSALQRAWRRAVRENITYHISQDPVCSAGVFESGPRRIFDDKLFVPQNGEKCLYNAAEVKTAQERAMVKQWDEDEPVSFYLRLPEQYQLPTPFGPWRPEWALSRANGRITFMTAEAVSPDVLECARKCLKAVDQDIRIQEK